MVMFQILKVQQEYIHCSVVQVRQNLVLSTILEQLTMDTEVQATTLV